MESELTRSLKGLIDDTGLFKRDTWASILGTNEETIGEWLKEDALPKPSNLYMLYVIVERSTCSQEPLKAFKEMAQKSSTRVSEEYGILMLPNVWEYMMRPESSELGSQLTRLDKRGREQLLTKLYLK